MADSFEEMLADIDKLSDEQVSQLMAAIEVAIEVKRTGSQISSHGGGFHRNNL